MVKKETAKKDEKKQAKDTFDPVIVDSSQAATAVLMLDSVEDDVVVKASEAIYKFSEKYDANKTMLLQLDTIPRILKLIASENSEIHRNACLVLGSMSKHPAVGRALKELHVVPTLLTLLGPEQTPTVIEYAALALFSIAQYYSCRQAIVENNGLEPLIHCLSSTDPDVQKNAIDTLCLLLQEFEVKALIKALNGISPVVDLIKSEYAVIQLQALIALRLIAEDAPNRSVIRDTGVISDLVSIISTPDLRDLHMQAVLVLSWLFEDFETLQSMKDTGSLQKLIAVTSDTPPAAPVEEKDKKPKGKEKDKAAGKQAKKGKASATEVVVKQSTSMFIPVAAEVKEQITLAFERAARNVESRKLLRELEIEKMLILLLNHCHNDVQIAASKALRTMAEYFLSRDAAGRLGGIRPVIKLLRCPLLDVKSAAVCTLSMLTSGNDFNCREFVDGEGIDALLPLMSSAADNEFILDHALTVISNLSTEERYRDQLSQADVVPVLIKLFSFNNSNIQTKAAVTMHAFVTEADQRIKVLRCDGVTVIKHLLNSKSVDVSRSVTSLIATLAVDQPTAKEFCEQGVLDTLRYMQSRDETNNAYVDSAIVNLLNFNLSAKYALTGHLCATDIINDGFYDVGRLPVSKPFMPLTCYRNEPVNNRRPVLYVNAQPVQQYQQAEENDDACQSSVSAQVESVFDERLISMIDEVNEMLLPLQYSNASERVIALAQYVAGQMGGPISKGNFSAFSWELEMSQLKYRFNSNVIPLGNVAAGIHFHRALLFKVLGDRSGIPSSLVRGEGNRAWNIVSLHDECEGITVTRFPSKTYIVDLIHCPGNLMRTDSSDAVCYQQL